ncbi:MAG TPA: sulfotransferase domain-containing protein, partial [Candidatus Paceibacterota bacterium]|nr:sulfotransferase domain-containing protein [Candidatus Paceibacterota bacterium]
KLWEIRNRKFLEAFENHSKNLRCMIKYEDLLNNTFDELKNLYKFIDVKISDDDLLKIIDKYSFKNLPEDEKGSGKFTRSATPGKWRENFSEDEQNIMNEIMGTMLKKLGYEN